MIPSISSTSISVFVSPGTPGNSSLCSPSNGACRSCSRSAAGEPHGQSAVAGRSDHRVRHLLEEMAGLELGQFGLIVRLHDLPHRHAGIPQTLDQGVG